MAPLFIKKHKQTFKGFKGDQAGLRVGPSEKNNLEYQKKDNYVFLTEIFSCTDHKKT